MRVARAQSGRGTRRDVGEHRTLMAIAQDKGVATTLRSPPASTGRALGWSAAPRMSGPNRSFAAHRPASSDAFPWLRRARQGQRHHRDGSDEQGDSQSGQSVGGVTPTCWDKRSSETVAWLTGSFSMVTLGQGIWS